MNLKNNTIFITGGTSGIGLALAKKFLALGNEIIVCGKNIDRIKKLNEEYPKIHTIKCDVTKKEDLLNTYKYIADKFPKLNIVINNAGVQYNYDFHKSENTMEKAEMELNVNLLAPINITKIFLNLLMKNENPTIINIVSPLGVVPKKSAPIYCASKAGLYLFSKSLRYQLENTPVKIITVMPPLVDTDMTKGRGKGKISPDEFANKMVSELKKGNNEINVGMSKLLFAIYRISPTLAYKILKNK